MRRNRILIYLVLIVVVIVIFGILYAMLRGGIGATQEAAATPTPAILTTQVVTAGQKIYAGTQITEAMLVTREIPQDMLVEGTYQNVGDVVGQYARYTIEQGMWITSSMVSLTPGQVNLPGSPWAPLIPPGYTAISIPITRLSSVAFGIRDGDYVDVIVTMLLIDVDSSFQTALPNNTSLLSGAGRMEGPIIAPVLTMTVDLIAGSGPQGRTETDPVWGDQALYITPGEAQRPRLVSQLIMQRAQVLHVGTFPLTDEAASGQLSAPSAAPAEDQVVVTEEATTTEVERPDIVTLMVNQQDAVTLNYLVYSGAQITLALRNPNDLGPYPQTESATLQYVLAQYSIAVPAKLPYATTPRLDELVQPSLPNDVIIVPPE
ncbi:MAG: Flp pilus assembly protein CpaB [Anaerolineales bacterium]